MAVVSLKLEIIFQRILGSTMIAKIVDKKVGGF